MMRFFTLLFLAFFLGSCASYGKSLFSGRALAQVFWKKNTGKYFEDDGPHKNTPRHLNSVESATPKWETLNKATMRPYTVLGKRYVPNQTLKPYKEKGIASWYGKKFHGKKTSIGETYNMFAMTAAHKTLVLPSYAKVTRVATGKSVVVRLTDRGPFHADRIIDLSYTAAHQLGIVEKGSDWVIVESILPDQFDYYAGLGDPSEDSLSRRLKVNVAQLENVVSKNNAVEEEAVLEKDFDALEAFAKNLEADELFDALQNLPEVETTTVNAKQFFVQLGSFSDVENAEAAQSRFLADLPWLGKALRVLQKGKTHRVQIGPYDSRATAQKLADRIAKETGFRPALSAE